MIEAMIVAAILILLKPDKKKKDKDVVYELRFNKWVAVERRKK